MGKTAIIILEYNNFEDTINCIDSVEKYNTADVKYIIVDNCSTKQGVVSELNQYLISKFGQDYTRVNNGDDIQVPLPYVTLICNDVNSGYAAGNNVGIEYANRDDDISHILILNNDILFIEDIIPKLLNDLAANQKAAIVSPILLKNDKIEIDRNCARHSIGFSDLLVRELFCGFFYKNDKQYIPVKINDGLIKIELPSGSCMLTKKDFFTSIGGFDDNTFLYYEENILWNKINSKNYYNYLDSDVKCIHLGASSTKQVKSTFVFRESQKSMYYFAKEYLGASKIALLILKMAQLINYFKLVIVKYIKR